MTDSTEHDALLNPNATVAKANDGRFIAVTLNTPIMRGETAIQSVTLRKPKAGELRGLTMQDIVNTQAGALITLITRISEPPLTPAEAADLEIDDFAEIAGNIVGFFMSPAQRAQVELMQSGQRTN